MATGTVLATQDWGNGPIDITPELLTTWLVEHIMKDITVDLGGETLDSVVVTVPHGWRREHVEKCLATREAARAAQADGRSREAKRGDCPLGTKVADRTVDEPVAAAAYALHASGDSAAFVGKNMLIVDIGGGTTDLSLVRVGAPGEPLTVIDAVNNEIGGDYATALLLDKHLENTQLPDRHRRPPHARGRARRPGGRGEGMAPRGLRRSGDRAPPQAVREVQSD